LATGGGPHHRLAADRVAAVASTPYCSTPNGGAVQAYDLVPPLTSTKLEALRCVAITNSPGAGHAADSTRSLGNGTGAGPARPHDACVSADPEQRQRAVLHHRPP